MNKKEINEIKSLYDTVQDCSILKLAGCYVNSDKEKVKTFQEPFHNLPEEEMYKYLEIFRKTLSGTPGRNLHDMAFTDQYGQDPGTGKSLLEEIRKTELNDEGVLDGFYDRVIENYQYAGNYLILMIFQSYDVPGVTTDGIEMEDASEEVFSYILCSICPMKLTKPGLGFDDDLGEIHTLRQIFAVELPETGFLYPAFNGRSADDGAILFSSKQTDHLQDLFLKNVLGVSATLPARQQKEGFTEFVADVLGEDSGFETVLSVQENLSEAVRSKKNEAAGETVFLDKDTVRSVFEQSGVSEEKMQSFSRKFDEQFDPSRLQKKQMEADSSGSEELPFKDDPPRPEIKVEEKLFADNVVPVRNFEVKSKDMVLRINSRHTDLIDMRIVDGKKCLVIELTDDLTVNGIPVGGN
ncbi:MAG: DUF4317 domain-containing protein [Eubacterium sp.]|nr:DUF4317 domain-containing protein [Eubacterium sp.]